MQVEPDFLSLKAMGVLPRKNLFPNRRLPHESCRLNCTTLNDSPKWWLIFLRNLFYGTFQTVKKHLVLFWGKQSIQKNYSLAESAVGQWLKQRARSEIVFVLLLAFSELFFSLNDSIQLTIEQFELRINWAAHKPKISNFFNLFISCAMLEVEA